MLCVFHAYVRITIEDTILVNLKIATWLPFPFKSKICKFANVICLKCHTTFPSLSATSGTVLILK